MHFFSLKADAAGAYQCLPGTNYYSTQSDLIAIPPITGACCKIAQLQNGGLACLSLGEPYYVCYTEKIGPEIDITSLEGAQNPFVSH